MPSKFARILARLFEVCSFILGSHSISAQIKVGERTKFYHHGCGTVLHERTVIGNDCVIFQNVTIGDRWSKHRASGVPTIGDNVIIGAGAVLLGGITVGNNAVIGANAVVLDDVPENCMAVGVPAIIRKHTAEGM